MQLAVRTEVADVLRDRQEHQHIVRVALLGTKETNGCRFSVAVLS